MRALKDVLAHLAWSGVFVSAVFAPASSLRAQAQISQSAVSAQNNDSWVDPDQLPDSPGATLAQAQAPASEQQQAPNQPPAQPAPNQAPPSQSAPNHAVPTQDAPQNPVGTAAAEAPSTSGVAASQPAGAAIAPAKQRRARSIIIRTGAIIGAAVAVGVVLGLTAATSSKPPGAH
jgi:hypothetical protein